MKYRIALHKSEEGYSVSVPGLPGCWSQGATEQEALENIREAIREYLSVVNEQLRGEDIREIEVTAARRWWRRQDHIGVPRCLVEVRVDAEHEFHTVERTVEAIAIGRRKHRVPCDRDHGPDLTLARGDDLLGERGGG